MPYLWNTLYIVLLCAIHNLPYLGNTLYIALFILRTPQFSMFEKYTIHSTQFIVIGKYSKHSTILSTIGKIHCVYRVQHNPQFAVFGKYTTQYCKCAWCRTRYAISHIWENAKKAAGERRRGSQKPGYSNKIQNTATPRNWLRNTSNSNNNFFLLSEILLDMGKYPEKEKAHKWMIG